MAKVMASEWKKLPVTLAELCLETTLRCGQSFRWKKLRGDEWTCALHGRILSLRQDEACVKYRTTWPTSPLPGQNAYNIAEAERDQDTEMLLKDYLNLTPDLTFMYEQWSLQDANFKKRAPRFTGVRMLRQHPWEALIGFICSSNNNIVRISQMVSNLCLHYGPLIGYVDDVPFHDFPTPDSLTGAGTEAHLRQLGFGYRAGYITRTAEIVAKEKPEGWLDSICNHEIFSNTIDEKSIPPEGREGYRKAHEALLELKGVGPKVADCVCLMGLKWGEAVPVDTHVWQIAQRDYKFGKGKHKSLTKATYDAVGDHFRALWGKEAGWAHSVLFAADLKTFSDRLTAKIEVDVDEVKIKQEDGTLKDERKVAKREILLEANIKDEFDEEKENKVVVETARSQRAKRRKM